MPVIPGGHESVASYTGMSHNATVDIPENVIEIVDKAIETIGVQELSIVKALLADASMTVDVPDAYAAVEMLYYTTIEYGQAELTMDPETRIARSAGAYTPVRIPLPIAIDKYKIPDRALAMSRRAGVPLDVSQVTNATRNVNKALERLAWLGTDFTVGEGKVFGITNGPEVSTEPIADWSTASGDTILGDLGDMIGQLVDDGYNGPFRLFYPATVGLRFIQDFKTASDKSIASRISEIDISGPLKHEVASSLKRSTARPYGAFTDNSVVLIQWTPDVLDILDGEQPTGETWRTSGSKRSSLEGVVAAIVVPRVKSGGRGIVIGRPA